MEARAQVKRGEVRDGAGDAIRTRDIFLGKEVLYQLSYTRICRGRNDNPAHNFRNLFFYSKVPSPRRIRTSVSSTVT